MGTRNLTKVIDKDGTLRVAQYGQWDGYPSGQGVNMLSFISEHGMLNKIEKALAKCRWIEQAEIDQMWFRFQEVTKFAEAREDYMGFHIIYPSLSRDTGSDILKVIVYSNEDVELSDESSFEKDGLMCEGVYTLNFQTREFISWFNEDEVVISFDSLPMTEEEYLNAWKALTNA
jgi:hypothetical protein